MDRSTGDMQLIRHVRQHLYLYDTGSDNYKNVKLKENTWKKIAAALGLSVDVSKTRWKSLRTSYLRHCKLLACRRKESSKTRKWPLADELTFLNPYLVPTDIGIVGTNGAGPEEPEPLSGDMWARVYEDAKPQPMDAVAVRLGDEDDDDIEEIVEDGPTPPTPSHPHAPAAAAAEEMREAFSAPNDSNEALRADSVKSESSYSSLITLVEPDSVSRSDRRPQPAPTPRPSTDGGGGGGGGGGTPFRATPSAEDDSRQQRDTTRDFFLYLAETVKTFPPYLQAQVKGKCFEAVNSAELALMTPNGRGSFASPKC